ncbi:hypothetical protein [Flavobacterium sp.]|uniref:hypothetical protein n=1 Tax=Flavobacterium sp. TaxID=239 RepID=UPI003526DFED
MNNNIKNVLAVIVGVIVGSLLNGALISISGKVIPPPEGVDVKTLEGLQEGIHLFEPKHFLFPFLAHALGTLLGAFVAAKIASSSKGIPSFVVGVLFLIGGISMCFQVPAPTWFNVSDLVLAYIPMAFLGWKLGEIGKQKM